MNRRNFLKNSFFASTSLYVPSFLAAFQGKKMQDSRTGKRLIIVQLSGGNDGLNTVVPYRNDIYYKNRPSISVSKNEVLKLNDELGLNPALAPLQKLYDDGVLSIINSVGYPNPDRSHFRSMDIWQTASSSNEYITTGWLGRYLDSACQGCEKPHFALELDDSLSLALKGQQHNGFAMTNPAQLKRTTDNRFLKALTQQNKHENDDENVAYLYKTLISTQSSAKYLHQQSTLKPSKTTYPQHDFAQDLKLIAELMAADTNTQIYYVTLSGFDTHVNQKNMQERLLKIYAEAMAAFVQDLKDNGLLADTLIMTFSEFGRRVEQNASNGTDHGTANNVFLISGNLKQKGFYNNAPNLHTLDEGDLIYELDFRRIYATILDKWLTTDATAILNQHFEPIII